MSRFLSLAISAIEEGTSSKVGLSLAGFSQVEKKYLLKILLLSDKLGCKKLCQWIDTIFQVLLIWNKLFANITDNKIGMATFK